MFHIHIYTLHNMSCTKSFRSHAIPTHMHTHTLLPAPLPSPTFLPSSPPPVSQDLQAWHRPRISALLSSGVDLLACETLPALPEAEAIVDLLLDEFPTARAWISFSCKVRSQFHSLSFIPYTATTHCACAHRMAVKHVMEKTFLRQWQL